jgi:hypothetical protein
MVSSTRSLIAFYDMKTYRGAKYNVEEHINFIGLPFCSAKRTISTNWIEARMDPKFSPDVYAEEKILPSARNGTRFFSHPVLAYCLHWLRWPAFFHIFYVPQNSLDSLLKENINAWKPIIGLRYNVTFQLS